MNEINLKTIALNHKSTLVCEYIPDEIFNQKYQSEYELENEFIQQLINNGYEYIEIHNDGELLLNLRKQIEKLNEARFSNQEWEQILNKYIVNKNHKIQEKTIQIQQEHTFQLKRDDGLTRNVRILDKINIHNNKLQVIHQFQAEGNRKNRYDVTVLVNGIPMVHVELKRRGVALKEAFNQINRYQRDSFWAKSGLFRYVQLFVISNGTHTKYYSNTTRIASNKELKSQKPTSKTSNSFEFTSWWTDEVDR